MWRTPNFFYTSERFLSLAGWLDRGGACVIWPSVWVDTDVEVGLHVRIIRWSGGWGRWRLQIDMGRHRPCSGRRSLDWSTDGLDEFLVWCRQVFGGIWERPALERLLRTDPAWYRLVALGGAPAYYTRVLLARELIQRRWAGPEGVASGEVLKD